MSFEYVPRTDTPLIVGISGPSKSGKTGSALELTHGFQEIQGGDIAMLDSEAGRGNHYQGMPLFSDKTKNFRYKYQEFGAPFSPETYTRKIEGAVKQGIKHLIIDSMSHLHEGPGGILEWHEQETERMAKAYGGTPEKHNLPAWAKPKLALAHFRAFFTQQKINLIFCFRAKEKLKVVLGQKPQALGFQPIMSEDIVFEMITSFLLYPGAKGVPVYDANEIDEKKLISIPEQFLGAFKDQSKGLSAWHGARMAEWAVGRPVEPQPLPTATPELMLKLSSSLASSKDAAALKAAWNVIYKDRGTMDVAQFQQLEELKNGVKASFAPAATTPTGDAL